MRERGQGNQGDEEHGDGRAKELEPRTIEQLLNRLKDAWPYFLEGELGKVMEIIKGGRRKGDRDKRE